MTYYELLRLLEMIQPTDIICRVLDSIPVLEIDEGRKEALFSFKL